MATSPAPLHPAPSCIPTLSDQARRARSSDVRDLLHWAAQPGMISLAGGLPAASLFDTAGFEQACQLTLQRYGNQALQYGASEGQPRLRHALAALCRKRGLPVHEQAVLVTSGSQQALDLFFRALINPGDLVAVESPTYLAALQCLDLIGPEYLHVPSSPEGLDVGWLERCERTPKVLYLVPNFGNPSGATLPHRERIRLLDWAARRKVFIIEDDPYGALRFDGEEVPALFTLAASNPDWHGLVGYTSTLSKLLAPGLRLGWICAPDALRDAMVLMKQAMDLHSSSFAQEITATYLEHNDLEHAISRIAHTYAERAQVLAEGLKAQFGDTLTLNPCTGGMFLWGQFVDGTDTRALLARAREVGVIFVPGDTFYTIRGEGRHALRLSFSACEPAQLQQGVHRLAQAWTQLRHSGAASQATPGQPA